MNRAFMAFLSVKFRFIEYFLSYYHTKEIMQEQAHQMDLLCLSTVL